MKVTFIFPEGVGLLPVSVEGIPPAVGSIVRFSGYDLDTSLSFQKKNVYEVTRIDYGGIWKREGNYYHAEVYLKPGQFPSDD